MERDSYFADIKEMFEASERRLTAMTQETDRRIAAMAEEADRRKLEDDRRRQEADRRRQEVDRQLIMLREEISDLGRQLGYVGRSIGEMVELLLVPGICEKMNLFGHNFTAISPNKKFKKDKRYLAEVDLLLENGDESMAVEIKTHLTVRWVSTHLQRLNLLRENESITGLRGKVLYAAVAGISIDADARVLALDNGMYVVDMIEDEDRIEVTAPEESGVW
jgi:hypothetical protein